MGKEFNILTTDANMEQNRKHFFFFPHDRMRNNIEAPDENFIPTPLTFHMYAL